MRDLLTVLLILTGIALFSIFILPWLEFAVYGIALVMLAAGIVAVIAFLLWRFIRWNWQF